MVLLEHLLPAGRGRPAAPDRQHAGDLPAAGRGAVQHGLADARTQAHITAAAQQGLLLFPARIHGIPRRHDRRTATGRPAAEPQTERPGGGPQTLPRGRHHGPPHQHQTRSGRYVPPAGRAGHRPKADENTPEDTLSDALARTRPALHRGRSEPHADRPQQTGHFPLGQSGRHAARLAAGRRHAGRGHRRPVRLSAGSGAGDRRNLQVEQLHRSGYHLQGQQQQPLPGRRGARREAERLVRMADGQQELRGPFVAAQLLRTGAERQPQHSAAAAAVVRNAQAEIPRQHDVPAGRGPDEPPQLLPADRLQRLGGLQFPDFALR